MASVPPSLAVPGVALAPGSISAENVWRAPLVPAALAATAGMIVDRVASVPLPISLIAVAACLAAWAISRASPRSGLPLAYLLGAVAGIGAAYHHWHRDVYPPDDIGYLALAEPRPACLRGILVEEPLVSWQTADDPLVSMPRTDPTLAVLQATAYRASDDWQPVSGRVRLAVEGPLADLHVGDEVEVVGRLMAPQGPANPGETGEALRLRDQRIRAVLLVRKTTDAVTRVTDGAPRTLIGGLAALRGWGQRQLAAALPPDVSGLAMALLLGEGSTLTHADWDKYKRTGVVHILIVAGFHLVILAAFAWFVLRLLNVRRRRGALLVALFLVGYALLTGARPPALRAAVTICAACGALLLRRPVLRANSFALAWLTVAALNPADLAAPGCQLSFLTVALIAWGAGGWFRVSSDPLSRLEDEARPAWQRWLRGGLRKVATAYALTIVIWLAAAPLVASHYHTVSPIGILLLPPLMVLASIALVAGFLLLVAAAILPIAVPVFAWLTDACLTGCDHAVRFADQLPGAHWYVGDVPAWWLWVFYPTLLAILVLEPLRRHWRWAPPAALAWLCIGLLAGWARPANNELRCTFVAVGHGGAIVLRTPDDRTLLYDAGAMTGPEVTGRHIAPFLWNQGVRRIDEVLLSHADLDHFNGLPALLQRFSIGQVSCTPTFADRRTPGVRATLAALERQGVPLRVVRAGDRLDMGAVAIEVLYPPRHGPEGKENYRSLVLRIRHAGHTLLLTGDLEGPGLDQVLQLPAEAIDVMMAPHHGSKGANTPALAVWARPRVVVSCEGPPRSAARPAEPYSAAGARFLGTWPHGAVTIRSGPDGLWVETFRTGLRFPVDE